MNYLLLLFALPISTIILASILETILKNPSMVAAFFFAIYLIVTFAAFDASFLIFVIFYTIIAFISAMITRAIINFKNNNDDDDTIDSCNNNENNNVINNNGCGCNRYYCNRYHR